MGNPNLRIGLVVSLVALLVAILPLEVQTQDQDQEQIYIEFSIEETVVVIVRGGLLSRTIDIEDLTATGQRYVDFGRFEVQTGAITDYELRTAAEAVVKKGTSIQEIDVEPLQVRLIEDEMTGTDCPPSGKRVEVNEKVVEFISEVKSPDSLLLFTGCNNTAENTIAPIEARVDLARLPGDALSSGSQVIFTIEFIIFEK